MAGMYSLVQSCNWANNSRGPWRQEWLPGTHSRMGQSQGSNYLWVFSHLSPHYPGQTLAPTLTTNFGESLSKQRLVQLSVSWDPCKIPEVWV